jgi:hemerythrin-like metal-binding protein
MENKNIEAVIWDEKYTTGIDLIDNQHKELFVLTNDLFKACRSGESILKDMFKETMGRMVEYVRFHFGAEQELLQKINYPEYHDHKKQHDELIRNILEAVKEYNEGKKFVPNHFVRTLRDWIQSHIAIYDKRYALYIAAQKKKGMLTDINTR